MFVGSMSIQESFKRLSNDEIFSNPLDHLHFSLFARIKENISRDTHTESSFDETGSQSILEILDSIFSSLRFSVKNSFVH